MDEDVGILENGFHALRVRYEVRREVTFIELHAFHHFEGGLDRFGLFDRDRAIFTDLIHGVGNDFPDGAVPVC